LTGRQLGCRALPRPTQQGSKEGGEEGGTALWATQRHTWRWLRAQGRGQQSAPSRLSSIQATLHTATHYAACKQQQQQHRRGGK
jgi:hypothetical protein